MDSEATAEEQGNNEVVLDKRGKYRIMAEIKRLEQESKFLEVFDCRRCKVKVTYMYADTPSIPARWKCTMQQERLLAAVVAKHLEELEELERIQDVSAICKELLLDVEARPDALLPVTNGPANPVWNRWFEGPQDRDGCGCQIM